MATEAVSQAPPRRSRRRAVLVFAAALALLGVLGGWWLWQRGGFGRVIAGNLHATGPCTYDPVTGSVDVVLTWSGVTTGHRRLVAVVTAYPTTAKGQVDSDVQLGAQAVSERVNGGFRFRVPVHFSVSPGRPAGSVACYVSWPQ